jgi:hypothetical protein
MQNSSIPHRTYKLLFAPATQPAEKLQPIDESAASSKQTKNETEWECLHCPYLHHAHHHLKALQKIDETH